MRAMTVCCVALLAGACADAAPVMEAGAAVVVDSILPMPQMLARLQAEAGAPVDALGAGSATSRESLVREFVRAVEGNDAAALRALRLDAREFAYLYVPTSRMSAPPYRQPPALGWMLVRENSMKGEARVLREFGGRPLGYRGHHCGAPVQEGANTLWQDCTVTIAPGRTIRLFGSILARDGRYKFVSLAGDL